MLDAGRPVQLHGLELSTATPGFVASILAGDSESGPFPVTAARAQTASGTTQYTVSGGGEHRYYLIWITRLGPDYHTARINEVTAN